ncbi:MAG: barstar family protein [Alistipes sp.]|jgi:RNAse (barnase) inhibitor barstar|nr:barstar family protein [Alistipes sp.]
MEGFFFEDRFTVANPDVCYIAHVDGGSNLFEQLKAELKFPDYFGNNWDALNDCLSYLSWIEQKNVIIIHDELPNINDADLGVYIRLLIEQIDDWRRWKDGEVHQLQVVFPKRSEAKIKAMVFGGNQSRRP